MRLITADDLNDMNSDDRDKYVKKANIWKKPDYKALIDRGIPSDVVYFTKQVRDRLICKAAYFGTDNTPKERLARQKQYVETIQEIQGFVETIKTKADVLSAFNDFMIGHGYYERMKPGPSDAYYAVELPKARDNLFITKKLAVTMFFKSERDFQAKVVDKAEKARFGVPIPFQNVSELKFETEKKPSIINRLSETSEKVDNNKPNNKKINIEL